VYSEDSALSWLNDLASGLGIPAGAAALAAAMYAACAAAEKAARPEALEDIGRILKEQSWSHALRPTEIIERLFVWTFGEQHLSWRCVKRSGLATVIFFVGSVGMMYMHHPSEIYEYFSRLGFPPSLGLVERIALTGFVADYVALYKSRVLFRLRGDTGGAVSLVALDIIGSMAISVIMTFALEVLTYWDMSSYRITLIQGIFHQWINLPHLIFGGPIDVGRIGFYSFLFPSTLFTSIWTILILLSTTTLRLLASLQRFTGWFFDVDKNPVKAIGIVSAALVMVSSLIWSAVRGSA
jgi:hypothetical protein